MKSKVVRRGNRKADRVSVLKGDGDPSASVGKMDQSPTL